MGFKTGRVKGKSEIVIYSKDITNITGRKERAGWKLIAKIRKSYNENKGFLITLFEFCEFTG